MHGHVDRRTLRSPGKSIAGTSFYAAIPGPADLGGAVAAPGDVTALTTSTYLPVNTAEQSYVRVPLPAPGCGIRGIGIAPDSAIHTADVALVGLGGELERHRISPGNPLLGCRDE